MITGAHYMNTLLPHRDMFHYFYLSYLIFAVFNKINTEHFINKFIDLINYYNY